MVNQIHSVNIWAILVEIHKEKQQLHCSLGGISRVFAIMIVIVFLLYWSTYMYMHSAHTLQIYTKDTNTFTVKNLQFTF